MHSRFANAPRRTCIGCREVATPNELLRCVYSEALGTVVSDPRRSMSGRGAWIHPRQSCLDRAVKKKAFHRALRLPGGESRVSFSISISAREGNQPTRRERVADE
ncbi:YlxR family protein [Gleimia europaea]|uniref:YlxR family protein n=1 Tax=Gleimia europaea TaxID=66228 RepID=UPI0009FD9B0C|nr:YlxR family protein [Gleimia europaea]